jgi:hypothetical protein
MKFLRVIALVITLGMVALVVTAPGVAAAPAADNPVEVLLDGGDPFVPVTAQATPGSTVGAALVNFFFGVLSLFAILIDTILGGFALTMALSDAAIAACTAVGGFPFAIGFTFMLFQQCFP